MPKYNCTCGNIIDMGKIPCPQEYLFISDTEFDKFKNKIDSEELYKDLNHFLKCDYCGQIVIFGKNLEREPERYIKFHLNSENIKNKICVSCGKPVTKNKAQYSIFENMHWLCFHLEYEHGEFDPDEPCNDPSCPWNIIENNKNKSF